MDNSVYTILAGEVGVLNNLAVVSNNVSNANTVGFKSDMMLFEKHLTDDVKTKNTMPSDVATLSNQKNGSLQNTGNPLDLAIVGAGFFKVQTPNGIRYTRGGSFYRNVDGVLSTSSGYPLLTIDNDTINFNENDLDPEISEDGTVSVNGDVRATIGVVEFENQKLLRKSGDGLFQSDVEGDFASNFVIKNKMLESSNVEPIKEMVKMIELQRKMEVNTGFISSVYTSQRAAFKTFSRQYE